MAKKNDAAIELIEELISHQKAVLLKCAKRINPHVIEDDLLQPNDFAELENNPHFRYEEGVLSGILSVRAMLLNKRLGVENFD